MNRTSTTETQELAQEARFLHRRFFDADAPEIVVDRYVRANQKLLKDLPEEERRMVETVRRRALDPEAVELVCRRNKPRNALTQKVQILFYLVEVRAAYRDRFCAGEASTGLPLLRLGFQVLRTGAKLMRGRYLVWRHGLA